MIQVDVRLHNANREGERSIIAQLNITNDGTGSGAVGNYDVEATQHGRTLHTRVEGHARHLPVLDLLWAALDATRREGTTLPLPVHEETGRRGGW